MRKVKSPELPQALHKNQGELSNVDLIKFALTGMVLLLAAMSLGIYLTMSA